MIVRRQGQGRGRKNPEFMPEVGRPGAQETVQSPDGIRMGPGGAEQGQHQGEDEGAVHARQQDLQLPQHPGSQLGPRTTRLDSPLLERPLDAGPGPLGVHRPAPAKNFLGCAGRRWRAGRCRRGRLTHAPGMALQALEVGAGPRGGGRRLAACMPNAAWSPSGAGRRGGGGSAPQAVPLVLEEGMQPLEQWGAIFQHSRESGHALLLAGGWRQH